MQLHPTGYDPTPYARVVCRNSRWNLLVLGLIFASAPLAWWYLDAPAWVLWATGVTAVFVVLLIVSLWIKRSRPDNWAFALDSTSLWINLRDVAYHTAEPGDTVVQIPFREVTAARKYVHRYKTESSDHSTVFHRDVYLEILVDDLTAALVQDAASREHARLPAEQEMLGVVVRSKRTSAPIVVEEDRIRIKFAAGGYCLTPGVRRVLQQLASRVRIEPAAESISEDWRDMPASEFSNFVRRLATSGKKIDATRLLRRREGLSLSEALRRVDELCGC